MENYMREHLESMQYLYGDNIYVQMPNNIFKKLHKNTKSFQQASFTYSYLVLSGFLYKYSGYVDLNNKSYIQNSDMKQILGYSKTTKTVNYIIGEGGVLDTLGLTETSREYPVLFHTTDEKINDINVLEFVTNRDLIDKGSELVDDLREVVKNRNYVVKVPKFLFEYDDDVGTLYNYKNTHKITLKEFIEIIYNKELNTMGFALYSYLKSRCYGYGEKDIGSTNKILSDLGICIDMLYKYVRIIDKNGYVKVKHKGWVSGNTENNKYLFIGVK